MLKTRHWALICAIGACTTQSHGSAPANSETRPPNIVVILADDLGWADLSCYGSTYHETPNLDRLAAGGMRFTNAYAACPVCSPTRASILTGKYPARLNLTDWIPGRGDRPNQQLLSPEFHHQLPLAERTLAEALKPHDFASASIGKWHLGGEPFYPTRQGFDVNIAGTARGSPPSYYYPYARPNRPDFALKDLQQAGLDGEYLTDRLAHEAARFIEDHREQPFFLYLSHFTVHIPIQPKSELLEKYRKKGIPDQPHNNPHYAAMVQSLDESVGRVLETLDRLRLADQTIVIFTSDNGGLSTPEGRHTPATSNAPLRAGKGHLYEGGIREPLIVRWPGTVPPGSTCDAPVSSIDLYPTIIEAIGQDAPTDTQVDGVSLIPLLRQTGDWDRHAIYWHYPHYSNQGGKPGGAIRRGDYKLIEFYEDQRVELYNLREDIGETNNLALESPVMTTMLRVRLHKWRETVGARMPKPKVSARAAAQRFRRHVLNADSTYSACAALDVNRDGRLDVVCGEWWYEAPDWSRHFVRPVEVIRGRYDGYSELPFDVNGDGWLDLISANYRSRKLAWIEHPGPSLGNWIEHVIEVPGPMETARLHDVDRDGRVDVLPNGVRFAAWWRSEPVSGTSSARWFRHELPASVAGHGVGFGDLNGDGRGDVVGPRGWLEAPADARDGTWQWHPDFTLNRDASIPILVFDVDADGDNDIVWGRGHDFGLYWLEQRSPASEGSEPTREWIRHAIDTEHSQYHAPLLADLDGDGRPEVVAGRRYMGHDGRDPGEYDPLAICSYAYDPPARTWRRNIISNGERAGFGLDPKAVDLDGDGDIDLVTPGRSGLYWFENLRIASSEARSATADATPSQPEYDDHATVRVFKDPNGAMHPVRDATDWALRRAHILGGMQRAMGPLPDPTRRVPLDVQFGESTRTEHYTRTAITFASEPGDRVPAYLLVPHDLNDRAPAMLCLHQTTPIGKGEPVGLGGRASLHYADELARRGYVCLAPDYPSFGDYRYDFGADDYVSGSMKAVWNNLRAVDLLESLPQVDPDRIGCIGHSLGGHNALFTAAFDRRIRAVVTSCSFTAFHDYYGGKLAGWTSDRYMPRIRDVYGNDPERVPFDFHEVLAAVAPRPCFVNAPLGDDNFAVAGVKKVIAAASEVYDLLGAGDHLHAVYPDADHDFPDGIRESAYVWLDRQLR